MSVLNCNRRDCDNVMCDLYSSRYGYICHSCFTELVDSGAETNIEEFMEGQKQPSNTEEALARYSVVFRGRE